MDPIVVGFDAKRAATNRVGLGNYSRTLLSDLCRLAPGNRYIAYSPVAFDPALARDFAPHPSLTLRTPGHPLGALRQWHWRQRHTAQLAADDGVQVYHGLTHTIPRGLRCPSVVTIHDLIFLRHPEYYGAFDRWNYRRTYLESARRADLVYADSEATKADVVALFGIAPEKIVVTWMSCHARFRAPVPAADVARVRARYGLPERFVLFVGTIEPRKNVLALVRAFLRVRDRLGSAALVLAGRETPYARAVRAELAATPGAADRVRFLHSVPHADLPALYRAAALLAYLPLIEGFGLPVLEAMTAGTPVLTSDRSSLAEIAGDAAFVADPHSAAAIADALVAAVTDDGARARIASRVPANLARFSAEACVARVLAGYMRLTA